MSPNYTTYATNPTRVIIDFCGLIRVHSMETVIKNAAKRGAKSCQHN